MLKLVLKSAGGKFGSGCQFHRCRLNQLHFRLCKRPTGQMKPQVISDGSHSPPADEIPLERQHMDDCSSASSSEVQHEASNTSGHSIHSHVEAQAVTEMVPNCWSELMPKVARKIARIEVTNPEVVRVTEAFRAFERCASTLRDQDGDCFQKSRVSDRISTFWSHSWHGESWKKIITLIVFYNSFPAMLFSFLTVALTMLLFGVGILPGFKRVWWDVRFSTWSLCSGVLVASLVVILWRPRSRVFLDRICISQRDIELKAEAIFSLAGLLKKSDTMLILWDPTWTQRLWCLFELSAFLKSRQTQKQALIVRPIMLGPMSIAIFFTMFALAFPFTVLPLDAFSGSMLIYVIPLAGALLLGVAAGFWTVSVIRSYFRDLDVMKQQLSSISFDQTLSNCCQVGHVDPSGKPMLCDRKIVKECVNIWFGSQEAFEDMVRSDVLEVMMDDLSERVFTTPWALSVTSPLLWAFLDISISFLRSEAHWPLINNKALAFALEGLTLWLLAMPNIKDVLLLICRLSRKKPQTMGLEILKNLAAFSLVFLPLLLVLVAFVASRFFTPHLMQTAVFCGSLLLVSISHWFLFQGMKRLGRKGSR